MDFIDQLNALAVKVPKLCDMLQTEEATKNALVLPFIRILGYDIFDPTEVIPELGFAHEAGVEQRLEGERDGRLRDPRTARDLRTRDGRTGADRPQHRFLVQPLE